MKERNGYLFIAEQREKKLAQFTGALDRLTALVDWRGLAKAVNDATGREGERPQGGRPPYPTEAMLKIVVLQQLYGGMSDEQMEYGLLDRMSWQRFVGLDGHRHLPDARTIWKFKELLAQGNEEGSGAQALFDIVHAQIARAGFKASGGQMVDATFVTVPKTQVSEEDRKSLNEGQTPDHWSTKEAAHKDSDARWTIKGKQAFYGYKAHVNADQKHKIIRAIAVTPANVDDRKPLEGLLDTSEERKAEGKTVHADRGYHGKEQRRMLKKHGLVDGIARRDDPNRCDQSDIHARNKDLSKIRSRIEHVFGDIHQSSGKTLRCIGLTRVTAQSILKATVYNLRRWMAIDRRGACIA